MTRVAAIDIETTGMTWADRVLVISLAKRDANKEIETLVVNTGFSKQANLFGFALGSQDSRDRAISPVTIPEAKRLIEEFLLGTDVLALHNASFDLPYLFRAGLIEHGKHLVFDTMVMARCTGKHERVSLEKVLEDYGIKSKLAWSSMKGKRGKLLEVPYDDVEEYAREDARLTLLLAEEMLAKAEEIYGPWDKPGLIAEESDWVQLVSRMRVTGIQADRSVIATLIQQRMAEVGQITAALQQWGIKGPTATTSIIGWLERNDLTKYLPRTKGGQVQTGEEELRSLGAAHQPVIDLIVEGRKKVKEASTWLQGVLDLLDESDRVHPLFTASGAKSNRLTCRKPNAQAFPKGTRDAIFTARPGHCLVAIDFSQVELRLAASFAGDQRLANEFSKPDADPHMATAKAIFGADATKDERQIGKRVNFLSIYQGGAAVLAESVNGDAGREVLTEEEARDILKAFKAANPAQVRAAKNAEKVWLTRGYLKVLGGKRVYASEFDLKNAWKAWDFVIQPSAAELIKKAMLAIARELPECHLVNQVHDEVHIEIPEDMYTQDRIDKICKLMVEAYPEEYQRLTSPPVTLKVDVGLVKPGLKEPGTKEE